jgi:hypothetical protein
VGAEIQTWSGLWHPVWPGRRLRVVVVRRQGQGSAKRTGHHKPPLPVEALFTTKLSLSPQDILAAYRARWTVAMAIRDANTCAGLGQKQCRKR